MVKKFWILAASFGRTSDFGSPKLGQILSFFIYLVTLKISYLQLKRLKSLNFGGPRLGQAPILEPPTLVGLVYFSYLPIRKFGSSCCNGLMFKILVPLFWGAPPLSVPPNFAKYYLFFMFTYLENFMCLALKVKKFWILEGLIWGKFPILKPPIFVKFSLFFISTHFQNLIHLAPMVWKFKILVAVFQRDPQL